MTQAVQRAREAVKDAQANDAAALGSPAIANVNTTLVQSERALTSPQGLPGRPWYEHLIYAPGLYTGYGVKTVPAVREAI